MAELVISGLNNTAGPTHEAQSFSGSPSERLGSALSTYLTAHVSESLLVVLDEADVFVERQLEEYAIVKERCLAFQMRSRFGAKVDAQGLPRVRFLFAGYRVTNRSVGPWANWGSVLSLDPLDPEDAARLVGAPLATMGVDIGPHAHEVAFRCGYQPAILLRFGERLMDFLERRADSAGERRRVSGQEISAVLEDRRVLDEIRTIVRNNFEGNPVGLVLFGVLLGLLRESAPAQPLREPAKLIVDRLRTLDSDLTWLDRDGDGTATVRSYVTEFVERNLLREQRTGDELLYSLRLPHHLLILAALADENRLREEIRRLQARSTGALDELERGLLSSSAFRDLREAVRSDSPAIAIVGTHWTEALYDSNGGVADHLGIMGSESIDADDALHRHDGLLGSGAIRRVDVGVIEHYWDELRVSTKSPLLLGGVDLLRWGLQRRRSERDLLLEVHGVGRLTRRRLAWWFRNVRGLEFEASVALDEIYQATGGIPLLLDVVDRQLAPAFGTTASHERISLALSALDEAFPALARSLSSGRSATRLEPRECEILLLVAHVVDLDPTAGDDLAVALTELWELFADSCRFQPLSSSDSVALQVLLSSGLLPANTNPVLDVPLSCVGAVSSSDPILRLAAELVTARGR